MIDKIETRTVSISLTDEDHQYVNTFIKDNDGNYQTPTAVFRAILKKVHDVGIDYKQHSMLKKQLKKMKSEMEIAKKNESGFEAKIISLQSKIDQLTNENAALLSAKIEIAPDQEIVNLSPEHRRLVRRLLLDGKNRNFYATLDKYPETIVMKFDNSLQDVLNLAVNYIVLAAYDKFHPNNFTSKQLKDEYSK